MRYTSTWQGASSKTPHPPVLRTEIGRAPIEGGGWQHREEYILYNAVRLQNGYGHGDGRGVGRSPPTASIQEKAEQDDKMRTKMWTPVVHERRARPALVAGNCAGSGSGAWWYAGVSIILITQEDVPPGTAVRAVLFSE